MSKKKDNKALAVLAIIIVMAVLINTYGGSTGGPGGGPGGDGPGTTITPTTVPVPVVTTIADSCVVQSGPDYSFCTGSCFNVAYQPTCGWDGQDCVCGIGCTGIIAKSQRDCDAGVCPQTNQLCEYDYQGGCICPRGGNNPLYQYLT